MPGIVNYYVHWHFSCCGFTSTANHYVISEPSQAWDEFFSQATAGAPPGIAYTPPPTIRTTPASTAALPNFMGSDKFGTVDFKVINDHFTLQALIRAYQIRGTVLYSVYICIVTIYKQDTFKKMDKMKGNAAAVSM